ncbi:uncharacterized protein C8Q71DRAFT_855475 [Rhodofomes roseus]|uniref:Transmembrane protein n=1 Tax=Rhodofomes roseus TaxID=34475 RepID=A0ABQ8KP41_9APHY|nr:uncharacterized protein C8Q71DRAFT_855475 [Rhodofomes roseus]KAH9840192.1 hypothetical protein C8Q71DRAFT_855475 [Rhodofomes roseus]
MGRRAGADRVAFPAPMSSFFLDNECFNAAFTLYFYERILTIEQEVGLVWKHASRGFVVPALHVSMHVCTTLYLLLEFVPSKVCSPLTAVSNRRSHQISFYSQYIATVAQFSCICALYLIWGGISAMRVFAINGRNVWAPSLIMALSLVPVATNVAVLVVMKWVILPPPDGCEVYTVMSDATGYKYVSFPRYHVETATRASVIAADALVLLATWRNTYGVKKLAHGLNMKSSITSLLLRDGTTYFCVLLAVNIIDTVLWAKNLTLEIDNFCFVFTTILLSRFFFNLREVALVPELDSTSSAFSDLHFSRAWGTLGGSLADETSSSEGTLDATDYTGDSETILPTDEEGRHWELERQQSSSLGSD